MSSVESVGGTLRSARESQGRSLAEAADQLCIMQSYLRAIEIDDINGIPGTFFYKSFVRQYAAILGVDAKLLQPGLEALTRPPVAQQQASDPIPSAPRRLRFGNRSIFASLFGLSIALVGSSGVYSWWTKPPRVAPAPAPIVPAP